MAITLTTKTSYEQWFQFDQDFNMWKEAKQNQLQKTQQGLWDLQESPREKDIRFLNGPRATLRKHEAKV
jgi:hypothetical protein